jgi:hypothetical protein
MNNFVVSNSVDKFEYLTDNMETKILQIIDNKKIAYDEAEYFGGQGGQIAIFWKDNKRKMLFEFGKNNINQVLKNFGVMEEKEQDGFLILGFGLHRHTKE